MRDRQSLLMVFALVPLGCGSPVCGEGFVASGERCIMVTERSCSEPCNAEAHEACDTSLMTPTCGCAPGYSGEPCTWSGVLSDPGFEDGNAWERTNGATILPFEEGPSGPGVAFLAPSVVCSGGAIGQEVEMPSYDAAEPLVAEVTYRALDVHGIAVGFGRVWKHLVPTEGNAWATTRFCLGEAAYTGQVNIQVASSEKTPACNQLPVEAGTIEIDRLTVEVAEPGECPTPGEILNGEVESEGGGWDFNTFESGVAGFGIGSGREGTDGLRLHSPMSGNNDRATATTKVSVPLPSPTAPPAIRFWWKGTSGHFFPTDLGTFFGLQNVDRTLGTLVGDGSAQEHTYCLPPWTYGSVVELSFFLLGGPPFEEIELVVDDLEVVSDAGCVDSTDILDPGFEAVQGRRPGIGVFDTLNQSVQVISDSERARAGDGFLEVTYGTTKALVIVEIWVFVPPPDDRGGPRVSFYSLVPAEPELPVRWIVGLANEREADLRGGGGWRLNEACLPPLWANRWYRFQVWIGEFGGADLPIVPEKSILLDDFEIATSAACPSE